MSNQVTLSHSILGAVFPTTSRQQKAFSPAFATKCTGTFSENLGGNETEPLAFNGVALLTVVTIDK